MFNSNFVVGREAIEKVLGLDSGICTDLPEMTSNLSVTFFPYTSYASEAVRRFGEDLKIKLVDLGVNVIPFEEALVRVPFMKIAQRNILAVFNSLKSAIGFGDGASGLFDWQAARKIRSGKRVRPGISIITIGSGREGNLPIDYAMSFKKSFVVTVVDMPAEINERSSFAQHLDAALSLFAYHMTNIVMAVGEEKWLLYNFNAAHPFYRCDQDLGNILKSVLIPKLAAPIKPIRLSELEIREGVFRPEDHARFVDDILLGGSLLDKTGLYPPGKKIDSLLFRNDFYRWIGKIHLDDRAGMSYGFLARQLPSRLPPVLTAEEARQKFGDVVYDERGYVLNGDRIYLRLDTPAGKFFMETPEAWVIAQRSGADKTRVNPQQDLMKMGLVHGKMILETPAGLKSLENYRPSFDTKVILAHAVGNAIVAALLAKISPNNNFSRAFSENGMALGHWHGYVKKELVPDGWRVYGTRNPHVSCSTPQAAIYALDGKLRAVAESITAHTAYLGDIHIEPHHGTNMSHFSLKELAEFLADRHASSLGNEHLSGYYDQ